MKMPTLLNTNPSNTANQNNIQRTTYTQATPKANQANHQTANPKHQITNQTGGKNRNQNHATQSKPRKPRKRSIQQPNYTTNLKPPNLAIPETTKPSPKGRQSAINHKINATNQNNTNINTTTNPTTTYNQPTIPNQATIITNAINSQIQKSTIIPSNSTTESIVSNTQTPKPQKATLNPN